MAKIEKTYKHLRQELDELLSWFENEDLDVDEAISKYEQAKKLAKELHKYLQDAQNKITKLS